MKAFNAKYLTTGLLIFLGGLLTNCKESENMTALINSENIGNAGGTITSSDGNVTLDIPPGALPSETTISISNVTQYPNDMGVIINGTAYDFGPDGIHFDQPVTIIFDQEVNSQNLKLVKLNGDQWEPLQTEINNQGGSIQSEINGFSTYAVGDLALLPLTLAFDEVWINPRYDQHMGYTEVLESVDDEHYAPPQEMEISQLASNPNCELSSNVYTGGTGFKILEEEHYSASSSVNGQEANVELNLQYLSAFRVDIEINGFAKAISLSDWDEGEGSNVFAQIIFDLIFNIENPSGYDYYFVVTYTALDLTAMGASGYSADVVFDASGCEYNELLAEVISYSSSDHGNVQEEIGTGRLLEINGYKDLQFPVSISSFTEAYGSSPLSEIPPYDGTASSQFNVQIELVPILK